MPDKPPVRLHYSARVGSRVGVNYDLGTLKRLFAATFDELNHENFFDQAFGGRCRYEDRPTFGRDVGAEMLRRTGKHHLWPLYDPNVIEGLEEEDLFDAMEILHDAVARPDPETMTQCGDSFCDGHYAVFDQPAGQHRLREELNPALARYGTGYRLTEEGQVTNLADSGLQPLEDAALPESGDPTAVQAKVEDAKRLFQRYHASEADRHAAIRALADALEYLRPRLKEVLKDDEPDLFNLANNFGIRHNNPKQKTKYDKDIWYRWVFYYYLATIHAATRLIDKADRAAAAELVDD